jgi:membrane protein YdbS with pleckstrin-like domain
MLEKLYKDSSEKTLKNALIIYYALAIVSFVLPILVSIVGYFLNGKIYLNNIFIFLIILIWSLFNVEYLKKQTKI